MSNDVLERISELVQPSLRQYGVELFDAQWDARGGALWALLGFGLALILCFVMPVGQTMIQSWVFQGGDRASRMWAFSAFGMIGSMLQAVIYLFLLVAIFAGRSKTDSA